MPLAPINLLAPVEAPLRPSSNTTLGALCVAHTACGLDVLASLDLGPNPSAQCVVELHQDAYLAPLLDVVVDCTRGRKRTRQQFPLASALQLIEQAVENRSQVHPSLRPSLGLHLDRGANLLPLLIGQVGRVRLALNSRLARCYHPSTPLCGLLIASAGILPH